MNKECCVSARRGKVTHNEAEREVLCVCVAMSAQEVAHDEWKINIKRSDLGDLSREQESLPPHSVDCRPRNWKTLYNRKMEQFTSVGSLFVWAKPNTNEYKSNHRIDRIASIREKIVISQSLMSERERNENVEKCFYASLGRIVLAVFFINYLSLVVTHSFK